MRDLNAWFFLRWLVIAIAGLLANVTAVAAGVTGIIAVGLGGTDEYREMYEEAAFLTRNTKRTKIVVRLLRMKVPLLLNLSQVVIPMSFPECL